MKGIIGRKLGMSQKYSANGELVPVTVLEAGPCTVLQVRSHERNGYEAIQVGFGSCKVKNTPKPLRGHVRAAGLEDNPPAFIREFRIEEGDEKQNVGDVMKADIFDANEFVDITGRSKGRGFQGVVKRWRFGGGRASHGGGWTRRPGSIGMCVSPGRVYKGRKMPGHMGNVRRTVQNLEVVEVRPEENLLLVKGSVPGPNGGLVLIRSACKK